MSDEHLILIDGNNLPIGATFTPLDTVQVIVPDPWSFCLKCGRFFDGVGEVPDHECKPVSQRIDALEQQISELRAMIEAMQAGK